MTVALTNQVSSILGQIIRDLTKTNANAKQLQATLKEIKLLGASGVFLGGLGFAGLDLVGHLVKPANEYQHQLALMNAAGMQQVEIAKSIGAAWQTTSTVMTTTATGNLQAIRELRMVFRGDTSEAIANMPTVQKLQVVLRSVRGEGAGDEAYTVAKALELKGAVRDPTQFTTQADMMTKAIIASGGKVTAQDFLSAFKFGRTATTGWSDEFAYSILPTLIQEMKGGGNGGVGGPGNSLMSVYQAVVNGTISQKSLKLWESLGLLDPSKEVWTKTHSLKGIAPGGVKGSDLFQTNPFEWAQQVLTPALKAHGITTDEKIRESLGYMFQNRTAGFMMTQMAMQPWKFTGDQNVIRQAQGLSSFDQLIRQDPNMAYAALGAQWDNLKTAFGISVVPILIPMIGHLTDALNAFAIWAQRNPRLVDALVYSFTTLSAVLVFSGTVLALAAAFKALRLAMTLGGLLPMVGNAIAGGGAAAGTGAAAATAGRAAAVGLGTAGASLVGAGVIAAAAAAGVEYYVANKQLQKSSKGAGDYVSIDGSTGIPIRADGQPAANPLKDMGEVIANAVKAALHGLQLVVDGKTLGEVAMEHGAAALNGPNTGVNRFDSTMQMLAP